MNLFFLQQNENSPLLHRSFTIFEENYAFKTKYGSARS